MTVGLSLNTSPKDESNLMVASFTQRSYCAKKETTTPDWYVVDAEGQIVGRFASAIAMVLMGKHKPTYTAHVDCGDNVIVTNVEKIRFSGAEVAHDSHPSFTAKFQNKEYQHYTGYPSGRKVQSGAEIYEKKPEFVLREAVRRMLPKNKLGRQMLKKLRLVVGTEHKYQAQQPVEMPEHLLSRVK